MTSTATSPRPRVATSRGRTRARVPISAGAIQRLALRLAVLVAAGAAWQVWALTSDSILIPTCTDTLARLWEMAFVDGSLWKPLWDSNVAVLVGFPITVVTGIPVGLALARWEYFGRFMNPYSAMLIGLPIAPLMPLILMALGTGLLPRVVVVILFSWIFVVLNTRAGVRSVSTSLVEMAQSFGASEASVWRKVLLPGGLPGIAAGFRIGLSRSVAGMIVAELLMVAAGIGGMLLEFRGRFQYDAVFAVVLAVILESLIVMQFAQWLERRLVPWN